MLKDLRITKKFPAVMISFTLASVAITGIIAFRSASNELKKASQAKLSALLESRKAALENYFNVIEKDLEFHSQSPLVVSAIEKFIDAWQQLPEKKEAYLKQIYIKNNPFAKSQRSAMLSADDNSPYSLTHQEYHPVLRSLISTRSFYDLFLIDPQGNLIYSVAKENDFASNLLTGQWKQSHLADVFNQVNANPQLGRHCYADFAYYAPSDEPASFIATAVFDKQKNYLGVFALQMPISPMNKVMQVTAGMGESGETYVVGDDLLMRSDSRFLADGSILKTRVDTSSVHQALDGYTGCQVIKDYRGIDVYSAYCNLDFQGVRWAVLAEVDKAEIQQPVYAMTRFLTASGLVIVISIFVVGYTISRDIANPIVSMTKIMNRLANNKLNVEIEVSERQDEVGNMAKAMIVFKQNAIEREKLQQKLIHVARHDTLTGLATRNYAMEQLDKLIENFEKQDKPEDELLAVMFADLDNFKRVNDSLGHHVGDELLKDIARGIEKTIKQMGIAARIGGDEFLIILSECNTIQSIENVARKLLKTIKKDFSTLNESFQVSLSLGIATFPKDSDDSISLVKKADMAMYKAKKSGKQALYWFDETLVKN